MHSLARAILQRTRDNIHQYQYPIICTYLNNSVCEDAFDLDWFSGSGEKEIKMSSMYFHYVVLSLIGKNCDQSFEQT